MIAFILFFLSGGIVSLAYLPEWVQIIARFIPNSYAVDVFRNTFLYGSNSGIPGDLWMLTIAAVVGLLIAFPAMRRGLGH
jgi:ABC-type multidrug transport system permease subunit